ncbi:MAG: ABC transporter permease [Methanobacteriaceae archaeon]|nr:ABC transporter permease [Methanobacteriaceae archaeon]
MHSLVITKWEFKNTLSSKKFITIFLLQVSILILMIIFFNSFMGNIEPGKNVALTPSLTGFASIDVVDNENLFEKQLNPDILKINRMNYSIAYNRFKNNKTTGLLIVPSDALEKIDRYETLNLSLFVNYNDPKRSVVKSEVDSASKSLSSIITNEWLKEISPENLTQPSVEQTEQGEPLPLQIINKVMIAILLFLPLFLFGNMVIDSIVGEKERKTAEILMAMPLSPSNIILGKSLAIIITIAFQVILWMIILLSAGFNIKNAILVYLLVILTSIPIIGITSMIAAYCKNYKEAGIGISFIYIGIVGFLVVPALAYLSGSTRASTISPMTLVMKLFSGETISTTDLVIPILIIIVVSLISYSISIQLFKRDDVVFGPRPSLFRLFFEFIGILSLIKYIKSKIL